MTAPIPLAPVIDEAHEYKLFTDRLIALMHIREDVQFSVGDALQGLETIYEDRTIQNVADDIGASASSLYSWRELAAFYVPTIRRHYRELGLFFSHFREAFKLGSIDAAYSFLDLCVAEKYTTTQAAIEARTRKGYAAPDMPLFKGELTFEVRGSQVIVRGLDGVAMKAGKRYECVIREMR